MIIYLSQEYLCIICFHYVQSYAVIHESTAELHLSQPACLPRSDDAVLALSTQGQPPGPAGRREALSSQQRAGCAVVSRGRALHLGGAVTNSPVEDAVRQAHSSA